jgi:3-(methylthio)propanoyl-CoA dehydrogenase
VSYNAPLKDMLFVMNELADLAEINQLPGCEDATPDTVEAVLEENAKFCGEVVAPLNHPGDKEPSYWHDGQVTTSTGFKEAPAGKACSIRPNSAARACPSSSPPRASRCCTVRTWRSPWSRC